MCFLICPYYIERVAFNIYVSSTALKINHFTCPSDKLTPDQSVSLVVLSDLHEHTFGPGNEVLAQRVAEQSPDLILLAGDFINDDSEDSDIVCETIRNLNKIAPVYYALGNHELGYMERHPELVAELESAGATVLEEAYVDVTVDEIPVRIGGMYAYAFNLKEREMLESDRALSKAFLESFEDTDSVKVMMSHRPDSFCFGDATQAWNVDLVVSGHNHGGQVVLPFLGGLYGGDQGWFPEYVHGMYEKDGMHLFVTSGLGSDSKLLPRFGNRPEVAVITIVSPETE